MNPIIFTQKTVLPIWGFVAIILVTAAITIFGTNEMLKKRPKTIRLSILAGIVGITVIILVSAFNGSKIKESISIYEDRITCKNGTFPYDSIQEIGLYPFPNSTYVNGVVRGGTEYRLVVELPQGQRVVGGGNTYPIDSVKSALENALSLYQASQ